MKRGSALLIVLGMMAFMVISAVAFSAYMRYSRLPSSFLRRSSASRLLAKAALAEAIDEIDAAIGNNPHPGRGSNFYTYDYDTNSRQTGQSLNRNAWAGRVYLGTNNVTTLRSPDDTVSTLCLEALAYIPPALVNDVRYYSRRSNAAVWRNLSFDAGRYAFCAVDVSDFLDVNALAADVPRSTDPGSRLSLAYLFESDDHSSAGGSNGRPSDWDSFMENLTGSVGGDGLASGVPGANTTSSPNPNKVPLVSMADWNLAVYADGSTGFTSPFCEFVKNSGSSFYGSITPDSASADKIRRAAFVTDSYYPPVAVGNDTFDLARDQSQPFTRSEIQGNRTLYQIADQTLSNAKVFDRLKACIDPLGFCALYDYLDKDDEPISLAVPTCERVPMICGLSPSMANATLQIEPTKVIDNQITPNGTPVVGGKYTITLQVKYDIKGLPSPQLEALVTYPFRHESAQNYSYELGGRMAYFLTFDDDPMGLRTYNANDALHLGVEPNVSSFQTLGNAVLAVGLTSQTVSPSTFSFNNGPAGAVKQFSLNAQGVIPQSIPFLDVTYTGEGTYILDPATEQPVPDPNHMQIDLSKGDRVTAASCTWQPLNRTGAVSPDFAANLAATLGNASYAKTLRVNCAVWAWMKRGGRYVDLVPACVYDDADLNSRNTDNSKRWGQENLGAAYPVMRFDMTAQMAVNAAAVNAGVLSAAGAPQLAVTPQSVLTCDPRFNHAPEDWFAWTGNISEQTWLDNCECGYSRAPTGNVRRDGDIFMSVSDQEYLQSVYELANLVRFTAFYREGADYAAPTYHMPGAGNYRRDTFPANAQDTVNFDYFWRTYDPFGRYQDGGDDFEGVGLLSNTAGFRINPYSTQLNVMMAAFANTPHEWRVASANEDTMSGIPTDASGFNAKYAWNEYSNGARIKWDDLCDLCESFITDLGGNVTDSSGNIGNNTSSSSGNNNNGNVTRAWEDVWADLPWCDVNLLGDQASKRLLCDQDLLDTSGQGRVYNADRKFLYGYWRDCFALKQQLFLVFVRAEPTMMGGGAAGQTPPQLGARAVALVWRDPYALTSASASAAAGGVIGQNIGQNTSGGSNSTVHRTRILFYRQFE